MFHKFCWDFLNIVDDHLDKQLHLVPNWFEEQDHFVKRLSGSHTSRNYKLY